MSEGNNSSKVVILQPKRLERSESFFADAEMSDSGNNKKFPAEQNNRKIRRGSRSSRGNSLSEANRPSSASPILNDTSDEEDEATNSSNSFCDTYNLNVGRISENNKKKRRKKRKRVLGEEEKILRQKMVDIDKALCGCSGPLAGSPENAIAEDSNLDKLEVLRELAISQFGLLDDDIRRKAWPRLVNIGLVTSEILPTQEECESHKEYNQVIMDVNRSLKRFPPGIKEEARPGLQDQLTRLIVRVLLKHPHLHYYQGYHDVAITFLLVVGEELGYHIMQRISVSHLKEFMAPSMERTTHLLNYMYPIIYHESRELYEFLESSEVGTIFALPWMITWFGHVLPNYEDVVRLYDFFLAKPPLMPVYLATALILHREQEVLMAECDLAMVHGLLSRIPVDLPFEKLLVEASDLYDRYPPNTLEKEVERRMEKLKRDQERHRNRIHNKNSLNNLSVPVAVVIVAVTAPIVIAVAAYKYFNS